MIQRNDNPIDSDMQALLDFFVPEVLLQLQAQYTRHMAIEIKENGKITLNFSDFVNMVLVLGINVNIVALSRKEAELGLL